MSQNRAITEATPLAHHPDRDGAPHWIDRAFARAEPRKPFMVVEGQTVTYAAFADRVCRLTTVLHELCDRERGMAIVSRSAVEMAHLFVAALRAGIPVININPDLAAPEMSRALSACKVSHVFIDRGSVSLASLPAGLKHTTIGSPGDARGLVGRLLSRTPKATPEGLAALIGGAVPTAAVTQHAPEHTAMMLMTSGTTSQPKVVELSHRNLAAQLDAFKTVYKMDANARVLNPLPLHFTDGILHGPLHTLLTGATLYRPAAFRFDQLEDLLLSIYRDRITHFITVPTVLAMINRLPATFDDAFDSPDLRMIRSSGDRLPLPLWEAFEKRFGVRLVNTYGLSETVSEAAYCGPDAAHSKRGSIGKPVGCDAKIVDADGDPVASGQEGELLITGDIVMKGYRDEPALTAAAFDREWFKTGDLATCDEEGFLTITGRLGSVIITGGINVNPADVSDALLQHPTVADAVAFGLPDPVFGEKIVAAVSLSPGASSEPQALIAHCRDHLAAHKMPRDILIVDEIPRNPAGKALVRQLREKTESRAQGTRLTGGALEQDVLAFAADVFGCTATDLAVFSEPKTTLGWDSFAHVQLILEAEQRYEIAIPPREFMAVKNLGHLVRLIERRFDPGS